MKNKKLILGLLTGIFIFGFSFDSYAMEQGVDPIELFPPSPAKFKHELHVLLRKINDVLKGFESGGLYETIIAWQLRQRFVIDLQSLNGIVENFLHTDQLTASIVRSFQVQFDEIMKEIEISLNSTKFP